MCRRKPSEKCSFRLALQDISDLKPQQKKILEERYLCILEDFQKRANFYAFIFHLSRFIITVGSLIVPALLSIQYVDQGVSPIQTDPQAFSFQIYWTTWVISLMVTTANGIFTLFKVDKKYFLLHTLVEQLRSEGWQYLELSGRFSGFYTPKEKATHANQFLFFCHAVEKLKMRQVEEEYYKSTEGGNVHPSSTGNNSHSKHEIATTTTTDIESGKVVKNTVVPQIPAFYTDGLIPPTPLNPQLQQLLQVLSVDGGSGHKQNTSQEAASEMSVRPEVQGKASGKESLLRPASAVVLKAESTNRVGAEVSTESVEQKPKVEENP